MRWGLTAASWAAAFAVVHVYWALGGERGLATSAGEQLATERPGWFVALGLWGVATLSASGVWLGMALTRAARVSRPQRLIVLTGTTVGSLLLARGLAVELLLLAGAYEENAAITAAQEHWSLLLWNPWFVVGGTAFLLAARRARRGIPADEGSDPLRR